MWSYTRDHNDPPTRSWRRACIVASELLEPVRSKGVGFVVKPYERDPSLRFASRRWLTQRVHVVI